ncbi:MAG: type II toxin-antitoxin system prevent-host-death family antitoxin [Thermoflexia bacterium]|nr:MAG: type II toxin-antitoxin system prevent-host-death family antitoxin [Thermoflexia bacterium]
MPIKQVEVQEAQGRFRELVDQVIAGTEFILTDEARPVARIVPVSARTAGLHSETIWISPDSDEPLPDEFWTGSE